jgi:hypothetical protein
MAETVSLEDAEQETRRLMVSRYVPEIQLVNRAIELYLQGFQWLAGKQIGRQWHRAVLMLGARSFNSLRMAQCQTQVGPVLQEYISAGGARAMVFGNLKADQLKTLKAQLTTDLNVTDNLVRAVQGVNAAADEYVFGKKPPPKRAWSWLPWRHAGT